MTISKQKIYITEKIYIYRTQIKFINLDIVKVVFSETDLTRAYALGRAEFKLAETTVIFVTIYIPDHIHKHNDKSIAL